MSLFKSTKILGLGPEDNQITLYPQNNLQIYNTYQCKIKNHQQYKAHIFKNFLG